MLPKRCEKEWPVIFDPKVAFALHKFMKPFVAFLHHVGRFQMFLMEPFLVSATPWRLRDRSFTIDAQKKIDSSLFVCVW